MIVDRIEHIGLYASLLPALGTAAGFLQSVRASGLADGDLSIDGERVFGFVRDFALSGEGELRYESHRRYIDIQYVLGGGEEILCARTEELSVTTPYDADRDIAFHGDARAFTRIVVREGEFALFFPWDAHKPCCRTEGYAQSRKLIIKISAEGLCPPAPAESDKNI